MKTVVLLEDDMLLSVVEERMLTSLGYKVLGTAISGEDGLKKIEELKPDVVVSDQNLMRDMNGLDVVAHMRRKNINTPVLLLSGYSSVDLVEDSEGLDNLEILCKPINLEQLRIAMSEASRVADELTTYAA
ncbi:response regulator [Balneola vulgaris]|jgi:DNA-binding NtrC family response regulator|uniref:response regulator n=1 Tax=Balneola vulgaris TaxID=287535 RepID=UPI000367A5C7|nr:response regulator [Balneola vulgaris]